MLKYFKQRPDSRIILVASGTHDPNQNTGMPAPVYTTAKDLSEADSDRTAYTTSKLCNILYTYELVRKLAQAQRTNINVNAFDPGLMPGTGLARDYNGALQFAWNWVLPMFRPFMRNAHTTADSGSALAHLATDPSLSTVTGKYFEGFHQIPSSTESHDEQKATDLWNTSTTLVGLPVSQPFD